MNLKFQNHKKGSLEVEKRQPFNIEQNNIEYIHHI